MPGEDQRTGAVEGLLYFNFKIKPAALACMRCKDAGPTLRRTGPARPVSPGTWQIHRQKSFSL